MPRLSYGARSLMGFIRGYFRVTSRLKPSHWVEQSIALPTGGSEIKPGKVSFAKRPYWREPLDMLVDPAVQDVIVIAPTRMGKTFMLRMAFAYVVAVLRLPMLWYDSTVSKAMSVSKKELQPLIERNKVLRDRKPSNPDHYTNHMMLFPGAHFEMFGANSDAQSSGETAAVILGNELGKWRADTESEASILDQTRHRTESFDAVRFHLYGTTPTVESGIEWIEYEEGDQRKYHVACPHCGVLQELVFGGDKTVNGIKWDLGAKRADGKWDMARVAESVHYRCIDAECTEKWSQDELLATVMNEGTARWVPTAEPLVPNKRSYQISGIYDYLDAHSMAALVTAFLSSRKSGFIADRRDFWNALMGMPWVDDIRSITAKSFAELELNYFRGELPEGLKPDMYVLGFDVQTWGMPWVMSACMNDGTSYVIDWGVAASWTDLDLVQTEYAGSKQSWVIGDMRFAARRPEVLQAIYARRGKNWVAFQGEEITQEMVKIETANPFMGGKMERDNRKVLKFVVSTYNIKLELEARYSGELKKTFFPQLPLAADAEEVEAQRQFYAQISAEKRVPRKRRRKGQPADEFKAAKDNHWGDCMVEIHAMLYWLRNRRTQKARKARREIKVSN